MGLIGVTGGLLLVPWVNRGEESQLAGVVLSTGLGESVGSGSKRTEQSKVVRVTQVSPMAFSTAHPQGGEASVLGTLLRHIGLLLHLLGFSPQTCNYVICRETTVHHRGRCVGVGSSVAITISSISVSCLASLSMSEPRPQTWSFQSALL